MKIIIKNIINENIDPEEKYVSGLSNLINIPYFYNLKVTDTPEHLWNRILSKKFNKEVTVYNGLIYVIIYDSNNNQIYYEDSYGYWYKQEFDSNNNRIYYEDSRGRIIDNRPNNPINENIDPEEKYVNGLSNLINIPYFYNLKVTDTPEHLWNRILSKVFNQEVRVKNKYEHDNYIYDSNNNRIYYEDSDGFWIKREYDKNNNIIYREDSDGYWEKREFDKNNNRIYYEDSNGQIIDNRPSNSINENIDPEEKYVNGLSNLINIPYFYNLKVTDTPEHLWNRILSKVFKQEVTVSNNYIYDSNNNIIYREDSNGYWVKREFDSNNNIIYWEDSDGYWEKREYDSNNNEVYYENSYGFWIKREYDSNNNLIYWEDSDGEWYKQEYDKNNNRIYYEDSKGSIIDKRNINENIDPEEKYVNGLSNIINVPYLYNLKVTDTPEHLWDRILSKVFNLEVRVDDNYIFDKNNNIIYREDSDGNWYKLEYDANNNRIYFENSNGYWEKREFDSNNNEIYFENSIGKIIDKRNINENIDPEEKYVNGVVKFINIPYFYNLRVTDSPERLWNRILSKVFNQEVTVRNNYIFDSNNNEVYFENSYGGWEKREYDSNNNGVYYENSNGFWYKQEFNSNNNVIYYENSDGDIIDKRNINENIDPEEKYVNGIVKFINVPYFYNLSITDTPKHLWNRILSKVFNQEVRVQGNGINDSNNNEVYFEYSDGSWSKQEYDSNNNQIYWEYSYGYWRKQEFDKNNNVIYSENSDGEWYKQEFDKNNNIIYREDSDGDIIDNRPSNSINENIDPEEKYVNGIVKFINIPYFYNLSITETPKHLWNRILSKKFNKEVTVSNNYIYDSNNNEVYFERSNGYWVKREFDLNGNIIYFENSDDYWVKQKYDSNNNRIYYENSNGKIIDQLP